jgi:hypothetical protein
MTAVCHHYSPAAVRLSCHHCSFKQFALLNALRPLARAPPLCTRVTLLSASHFPGRSQFRAKEKAAVKASSGKLRPPIQHAISPQPHCAWRKSSRETRMCRYVEQLLYRSTIYLSVLEPSDHPLRLRACPSVRNM